MKRIDAMVPSIKRNSVVHAILNAGADGLTISETRGRGSGTRPMVGGAKGTARYIAEYSRTDCITTIVEDSKVLSIVNAIMNIANTGKSGDGKIFVSTVLDIYDIATKSKTSL